MKFPNVIESSSMSGNNLQNQLNKKGGKNPEQEFNYNMQQEALNYDKQIYKAILEEVDYREPEKIKNTKIISLMQEFPNLLRKNEFVNFFSQVVEISSPPSSPKDIFEGLTKILKLNFEFQFKILLSFIRSNKEKFVKDALSIFPGKCAEIFSSKQDIYLSNETIQSLINLIKSTEILKNDNFLKTNFINFLIMLNSNNVEVTNKLFENLYLQIDEFDYYMQNELKEPDAQEFEKILTELANYMLNQQNPKTIDMGVKFDEKRFATFLLFLLKHQSWVEDPSSKILNKIFLKVMRENLNYSIDESNEKKYSMSWSLENFYRLIKNFITNLDFNSVIMYFDDKNFSFKDKRSFEFFVLLLNKFRFPIPQTVISNMIFKKWNNEFNQIEFLNFLINNPNDNFSFRNCPRKVQKIYDLNLNKPNTTHLIEAWSCIDLIEILIKLSKGTYYQQIKEMFAWPIENIPEIIVTGLFQIKIDGTETLFQEIVNNLLQLFLGNHLNSLVVLEEIWNLNKELLIKTICSLYRQNMDLMNLSKILDISQKIKDSLIPFASCSDHNFTVNFAILAVKRDFLHIDQWLSERIRNIGDDFIIALLNYLKENIINQCKEINTLLHKESILEKCQLSIESIAIIFENLSQNKIKNNPKVSKGVQQEITNCYKAIFEIFEELQSHPPNSEETENAANKLLNNIFSGEWKVEELVETLKNYKNSNDQNETEIYACVIHSLLDEYRFLSKYPDNELKILSCLFGQIINVKILDGVIETIALKYIVDSIKKGSGKIFTFGVNALEQFIDKIGNWPDILNNLYSSPYLKKTHYYEKILNAYEEYITKNKMTEISNKLDNSVSNTSITNPYLLENLSHQQNQNNSHFINFDQSFENDKKSDKTGSSVNKMPKVSEEDFYSGLMGANIQSINPNTKKVQNFSNMQTNINTYPNPNYMYQSQMNQYPNQNINMGNMAMNPNIIKGFNVNMNNPNKVMYPGNQMQDYNYYNMVNNQYMMNQESGAMDKKKIPNYGMNRDNPYINPLQDPNIEQNMDYRQNRFKEKSYENEPHQDTGFFNEDLNINNSTSTEKTLQQQQQSKLKLANSNSKHPLFSVIKNDSEFFINTYSPPQEIINKINFTFNTLTKNNVTEKSNELKGVLGNDYISKWFSNYLILNRVANETNNHSIYNDLVTNIDIKPLNNLLIKDTIYLIKKLLSSETIKENAERNYLKNLGSWLGIMTLSKNKPIITRQLDLKLIIYEAYETGKLTAVIPLITKILEHTAKNRVFHVKNPWINALLLSLNEIYNKPNLKSNLKYEIEILFKKLEVERLPESKYLEKLQIVPNSPDFSNENMKQSGQQGQSIENKYNEFLNILTNANLDKYFNDFHVFLNKLSDNLGLSQIIKKEEITKILSQSLFNAINEILLPLIDRAVNISLVTTKELILKDFSFEKDEKKIKTAAIICIKSLSASLGMVTCKEVLKNHFLNQLKDVIKKIYGFGDELLNENYHFNHNEFLEMGYVYFQNNVVKRAVEKIENDMSFNEELNKRRNNDYEIKKEVLDKINNLPKSLQPTGLGIPGELYRIYEDFEKYNIISNESIIVNKEITKKANFIKLIIPAIKEALNSVKNSNNNLTKIIPSYDIMLKNVELLFFKNEGLDFSKDSDDLLSGISKLIIDSKIDKSIVSEFINSNIRYIVFSSSLGNTSLLNIYCEMVKGWIKLHPTLSKDYTEKVLNYEDYNIRFNFKIHLTSFKKELFDFDVYETILSRFIRDPLLSKAVRSMLSSLIVENIIKINDFKLIPEFMLDSNSKTYFELFNPKIRIHSQNIQLTDYTTFNFPNKEAYDELANMVLVSYRDVKHLTLVKPNELGLFFQSFNKSAFAQIEDQLCAYIMIALENELQAYSCMSEGTETSDFLRFDIFSNFLILCLRNIESSNKLKLFEPLILAVYRILHLNYVKNPEVFNQRPYFRIFFNICNSVSNLTNDNLFKSLMFFQIFDVLRALSPNNYPAFFFAWLDIISSRNFIANFLENDKTELLTIKFKKYYILVSELLSYLNKISKETIKDESFKLLMNNVTKFMYSISKTYPEFFAFYYLPLINLLPYEGYAQIKNIILSAIPNDVEVKDPFSPDFNIDNLTENKKNPVYLFDANFLIQEFGEGIKTLLDGFYETKDENKLRQIINIINMKKESKNIHQIINLLAFYFMYKQCQTKDKSLDANIRVKELIDIYFKFLVELEIEVREIFINALLNELRYPNKITYLISKFYLKFLVDLKNELIEEQMFKSLVEKLLIKPFTWGLIVSFIEISKYYQKNNSQFLTKKINDYVEKSKFNKNLENYLT